jgi:nicotinamide-nucleotide amidase
MSEATRIGDLLGSRTLACAESCTGGLVAQAFAAAPGSMDWFAGGIVAYQRAVKESLLAVPKAPLVTPDVAEAMAAGAARLLDADVAVSVTCAAGPAPLDGAAPGTVVIGVCVAGTSTSFRHQFDGSPAQVCEHARDAALADLLRCLRANGSSTSTVTGRPTPG